MFVKNKKLIGVAVLFVLTLNSCAGKSIIAPNFDIITGQLESLANVPESSKKALQAALLALKHATGVVDGSIPANEDALRTAEDFKLLIDVHFGDFYAYLAINITEYAKTIVAGACGHHDAQYILQAKAIKETTQSFKNACSKDAKKFDKYCLGIAKELADKVEELTRFYEAEKIFTRKQK